MAHSSDALGAASRVKPGTAAKYILWSVMALAVVWVFFSNEVLLLGDYAMYRAYRLQLIADRWLFVPHAICGTVALLSGPPQFSTRLRARHLQFHRILGRVYVFSVFIAALIALYITWNKPLMVATCVQAGTWIVCTLAALLTARNRQIAQHRQWMVRSYAVTFTFISTRILSLWPAYWAMTDAQNTLVISIVTFASVLVADLGLNWRELTTSRKG